MSGAATTRQQLGEPHGVGALLERAALEVCRDNHGPTVGDDAVDPDAGRYVCMDEHGRPIIDTSDPAEVVRRLDHLWWKTSERCEKQEQRIKELALPHHQGGHSTVGHALREALDLAAMEGHGG